MNSILLIDDRKDFIDAFTADCAAKGYALYSKRSLAGLKELMPAVHHKIACVILDIKCLHTEDQEIEDPSFITSAITYLDQNFAKFPRVILTGDDKEYDQIKKYYKDEDIYLKITDDKDRLFSKIKYYVDNSTELRVRRLHFDAFMVFDNGYLNVEKEKELIRLLLLLEGKQSINVKDEIAKIRKYLESIFLYLNTVSTAYMPNEFFTGDHVNLKYAVLYLTGRPVDLHRDNRTLTPPRRLTPEHVGFILSMLKDVGSVAGNHDYSQKTTFYALSTCIYGLVELLIWLNDFMEKLRN